MSRTADGSGTRGYGRYVGRVGALALFRGGCRTGTGCRIRRLTQRRTCVIDSGFRSAGAVRRHRRNGIPVFCSPTQVCTRDQQRPRHISTVAAREHAGRRPQRPTGWAPRAAAVPDEALAGAAQWIRRHVGAAFFNAAPTISFDPAQNAASQYGVVTGSLNGVDREGDKISYLLTSAPAHGSVIIRPDGTFSYVPTDKFAATGGTDTFMVRADDHPETHCT